MIGLMRQIRQIQQEGEQWVIKTRTDWIMGKSAGIAENEQQDRARTD